MTEWLAVLILGIIEGITEFLPVSSTGHLLLAETWLPRQSELFIVVIQAGAVLAVIPLFRARFRQFLFNWREPAVRDYALKIVAAFVITGFGGLALKKAGLELPETVIPVAIALIVGGIAFIAIEQRLRNRTLKDEVTWSMALAVGAAQLVAAAFPGTSRSGACILLLLLLGLSRPLAAEFAFLVGIPTMLAAGGYEILKTLQHTGPDVIPENWSMVALGNGCCAISRRIPSRRSAGIGLPWA
jgi:undecaprenyl-diphosphatase